MQHELTQPSAMLDQDGKPVQVGWSRHPLLDCNLEAARFYRLRLLQRFRIKRWDYYALFTPEWFFAFTIADLGYAGNLFAYALNFASGELHEEGAIVPLGKGIRLPRNPTEGDSHFHSKQLKMDFQLLADKRSLAVSWPGFNQGRGLQAEVDLGCLPKYESMNILIPIGERRFYCNTKINCLPASGNIVYGEQKVMLDPVNCSGSLDWGRGVWEYQSYWNWASASGFLLDGRSLGLNLGCGFGDLSQAGENAIILDHRIHKLEQVKFDYDPQDYLKPWHFMDEEGRLDLVFTPFKDRLAQTNLGIITSRVHQLFGKYNGQWVSDSGERMEVKDLLGFAEEHHARW